jgi:hypothetical protein
VLKELAQSLIESCFFGCHPANQYGHNPLLQRPKVLDRHRFEIATIHFFHSYAPERSENFAHAPPYLIVAFAGLFRRIRVASMVEGGRN